MSSESTQYQKLAKTKRKFDFSNIEASERDVQFYTGLPSAEVFYQLLDYVSPGPDRTTIHNTMPAAFKELYPNTTAIVDATEIRANIPSSLLLQSQTYSNYKSTNTFKALIAISPAGHVTFVSSLYTGCIYL